MNSSSSKEELRCSKSRLNLWQDTWLASASDPTASPERLWEKDGSVKIQDIRAEMADTNKLLEDAHKDAELESDRAKVGREAELETLHVRSA